MIDSDIDPEKTRVLLVWINKYKLINNLDTSRNDVREMRNFLISRYKIKESNIVVLTDQRATKRQILRQMRRLSADTPDDKKMIIFFSWHWIALDKKSCEVKDFKKIKYEWYISSYESDMDYSPKIDNDIYYKKTWISRREINSAVWAHQKNLLILDACFWWAMTKWSKPNEIIISASDKEIAIARAQTNSKMSLFSNAVFETISWNKKSLWNWVLEAKLKVDEKAKLADSPQEPIIKANRTTYYVRKNKLEQVSD